MRRIVSRAGIFFRPLALRVRSPIAQTRFRGRAPIHTSIIQSTSPHPLPLSSLGLLPTAQNDNCVSCTTVDLHGNIESMSKQYPKMEFLRKLDLYPRDLRKIDNSSIDIVPTIAVRKNCILVNLLHIKSIIMKDSIMIFDTSDASSVKKLGLFIYDLQDKLKTNSNQNTSFEFKALETILINVMSVLENDLNHHIRICSSILTELENQIDRSKLRDLLIHSKSLTTYYQKTLLIRNVLDELLETDEDLRGMYLTLASKSVNGGQRVKSLNDISKERESEILAGETPNSSLGEIGNADEKTGVSNTASDIDDTEFNFSEVEFLLENYYNQCDEFVQQASSLISDIKSTEEIVNIILDSNRNSLMLFDLKITIYTLGFTVATTLPAFYGMNLKNFIEDSNYGFGLIVGASIVSALGITAINFNKLCSVQRLTMMLNNDRNIDRFFRNDSSNNNEIRIQSSLDGINKSNSKSQATHITDIKHSNEEYQSLYRNHVKNSNVYSYYKGCKANVKSQADPKTEKKGVPWWSLYNKLWWNGSHRAWWDEHHKLWWQHYYNSKVLQRKWLKPFWSKHSKSKLHKLDPKQKAMAWKWLMDERQRK